MNYSQFYLAANIPQWGIFLGVVFIIVGYIEKKKYWNITGWSVLILISITSLIINLLIDNLLKSDGDLPAKAIHSLISSGWQLAAGALPATASLFFYYAGRKNYRILAILTIIYFMLIFFEFNSLMSSVKNPVIHTEKLK